MKRKVLSVVLILLMVAALPVTCFAQMSLIQDQAGLMDANQQAMLEQKACELSETYQMDIVIVTTDSNDGKDVQSYADDFFDENGYGADKDGSGILLLVSMDTREWAFSTSGNGIYAFTDYSLEILSDELIPYLSSGEFYDGFSHYLSCLPTYLDAFQNGKPVDGYASDYDPNDTENVVYYEEPMTFSNALPLACIIGLVVAGISVAVMASAMNTRRNQTGAEDYLVDNSFQLQVNHDHFLFSNVTKTRRVQENNNSHGGGSSHGGGGSHVHTSSSGRSHGGRSGKF